jgi:hypothetical protein
VILLVLASTLIAAAASIHALVYPDTAEASTTFSIKTGYYLGSGTQRSITGLGFKPEVILIKSDTTTGPLVWKSSAMSESATSYLGVATADNTESEVIFDDDGFTISPSAEVNSANVNYTFVAFAGSDCTAAGSMCVGVYTGDNNSTQSITTGFQPDLVWVKRTTALAATFRTSSMIDNAASFFMNTASNSTGIYFTTLDSGGFTVGSTNNTLGGVYYYVAFKNVSGASTVGKFTGNGMDNRNITGLGFEPDFVLVKQETNTVGVFNTTEMYGDYSSVTTAAASAANHIQELQSDGFQVGNSTSINVNGIVNHYVAFGGSPDPAPAGSFFMERGSFTGNGTSQFIETSFEPNLVFVKGDTTQTAVWSTSFHGDATEYFGASAAAFAGGINIVAGESGFNVGSNLAVNSDTLVYEYVAFGNATTPRFGNGAEDFYVGSYTGNGIDGRAIDHLGFTPSMVVVKRNNGTANQSVWKADGPVMADNTSAYFSGTADNTAGALMQTLTDDGFTLGTNAAVNAAGATYVWFAFAEGDNFDIGSYTGNGTADRAITGVGFSPDLVWVKRDTNSVGVHRSSSPTLAGVTSQHFTALPNDTNDITALNADGFTLGNSAEVNASSGAYRYAAWNSSLSSSAPDTPANSSPVSTATGQDLRVALVASAYADDETNTHENTQWQVDDDADFSSPVWTRTAGSGEASTSVTSANGTFANERSGSTELSHATTYYWRARYSDGAWSGWSTGTSFTTNRIATPTHTTPTDGSTVTTLTPVLSASSFSDPQSGHTSASAQWQVSATNDFSSPLYDSGEVSYANSYAMPNAILSDRSSYWWRVRYEDSSGEWSSYSTSTRFVVSESEFSVRPLFGSTVVDQGDDINIDAQVKTAGATVNDATVTIDIYDPSGTTLVDGSTMTYVPGSSGVYRYAYTVPHTSGSYLYEVTATKDGVTGAGAANFETRTIGADVADIKTTTDTLLTNVDMLIGGLIVVQSSVTDPFASTTAFKTALTNTTDAFYTNGTLAFTSGDLDGTVRRIAAYDGTTNTITVDPALLSAPANGDTFTITTQNLRAEEQLTDVSARLDIIDANVDTVLANLSSVDSDIATVQTSLNTLRSSQRAAYHMSVSDADSVSSSGTYRVTLTVLDYESVPISASGTPAVSIYDPTRDAIVDAAAMTEESTGVYTYDFAIPDGALGGVWETRITADPDGRGDRTLSDIWTLSGSAPQVTVNDITDATVPDISANVTITNEGGADQEYNYTWCVVDDAANECGGGDDEYTSSAAKLVTAGSSFTTDLSATLDAAGTYWFKIIVDYGSDTSAASLQFSATAGDATGEEAAPPSGQRTSLGDVADEIRALKTTVAANASKLTRTLDLLGNVDPSTPGFRSLLDMNSEEVTTLRDMQDKVTDLRIVSTVIRQIVEGGSSVKVNTFLEWGSINFGFLVTNPANVEQTIEFKSFLPEEVRPEHILDLDGLSVDFDQSAGAYYVHASITLGPKQSIVRKVHVEDIWKFDEEQLATTKRQANEMAELLADTSFAGSAVLLANDVENSADTILLSQEETLEPQIHILNYRENQLRMERIDEDMTKLRDLVAEGDSSRGIFGRLSGIEITSTWAIILAIVFGFAMLAGVLLMMWRYQMRFAAELAVARPRAERVRRVDVVRHAQSPPVVRIEPGTPTKPRKRSTSPNGKQKRSSPRTRAR